MLRSASEHYRRQQRLIAATVAAGRRAWDRVNLVDLDAHAAYQAALLPVLEAAQLAAADASSRYVSRALDEQGIDAEPEAQFRPLSLSGRTADGRPLASLLDEPIIRVKERIGQGLPAAAAMHAGLARLTMMLQTEVADAGRVASGVEIATRPQIGYTRMLNAPSCGRCSILAGRWYRYSSGFQRHPRCDCIHVPTQENVAGDLTTSPRRYFDSLTPAEQDQYFGKAEADAIRDGADMNRVVNATRRRSGISTTADGRRVGRRRPVPEEIYRIAPNREEALELLRQYGYLT